MTCDACSREIPLQPIDPPLLDDACFASVFLSDDTELSFHWTCYAARFDGAQVRLDGAA